ncbi:MAG: diguanylate cyclase (GGDEF)-like protein [Paracoccaceae bacterium]|jgi:diguanylate cyclase (GGDEF)-like protein
MRILIVDDDRAVRDAYRHAFAPSAHARAGAALQLLSDELFATPGIGQAAPPEEDIEINYGSQGLEAVEKVKASVAAGRPFNVAFVDIRMPPGIDGKETARLIRGLDVDVNIVIVSAYSDHSVTDIAAAAGPPDKIFYIAKPFAAAEVRQMAVALSRRWEHDAKQVALLNERLTELAASEARAINAANHDFLTGAPNRLAFQRELATRMAGEASDFALALLDLDRFKEVNDTLGHGAGDDLLKIVYATIKANCPPGTMVARLGGDEFGLLIDAEREAAKLICDAIVDACAQTFTVFGSSVRIGASAGLLFVRDHPSADGIDLIRFADLALFEAKNASRGLTCIFDAAMDESARFRQKIESGLAAAIEKDELALFYQPIVDARTLVVVGFEALVRWTSTDHGAVSPAVFIPIAEEGPLIHKIGDWVIARALRDSCNWPGLYVSINISPRQFKRLNLKDLLIRKAAAAGVPHGRIQIEITETALFESTAQAITLMKDLKAEGFRIAIDDFGTGHSSLQRVKDLALDCIKIDKNFVKDVGENDASRAIVSSIAHLAKGLGLTVVAEGVETEDQHRALCAVGCSHVQGFLFGAAEEVGDIAARLAGAGRSNASAAAKARIMKAG